MQRLRQPGTGRDLTVRLLTFALLVFPLLGIAHHHHFQPASRATAGPDGQSPHVAASGMCLACLAHHPPGAAPEGATTLPVPPGPDADAPSAGIGPRRDVPRDPEHARGPPTLLFGRV